MLSTLIPGDIVVVNKLRYGPKITSTPLSFPFIHKHLPFSGSIKAFSDIVQLPYMRLPGYADIEHKDLLVFHYPLDDLYPIDHRTYYVKRCMGLPGDTIIIKNNQVEINQHFVEEDYLSFPIRFFTKDDIDSSISALSIHEGGRVSREGEWELIMDADQKSALIKKHHIKELKKKGSEKELEYEGIFKIHNNQHWNLSNYGPLYIPRKGDTLLLNKENIQYYRDLITKYEKHQLSVSPIGEIYIDKKLSTYYICDQNYYFAMGDNRLNSSDSRYWGYIPEDHIVGKAVMILYSSNKLDNDNALRWDRFFKFVH